MIKATLPLSICFGLFLTGCASSSSTLSYAATVVPARDTLAIVQTASKGNSEFYFCDAADTACPGRSLKVVAVPAPKPKFVPQRPAIELPPTVFKVHFRWGWASLDADGRKELYDVLNAVNKDTIRDITIQGRTDPTGSRKYNERLAQRRAELVKKMLVNEGIRPEIITAISHTPCCNGNLSASKQEMREKRRVDLEITIRTIRQK